MKISRRDFLGACSVPLVARSENRLAICSETFAGMNFADACKAARRTGYAAIEIEPAHLSSDPASLSATARKEVRLIMEGEGLACTGLHSLLKAPAGLHLTISDQAVRRKSWDYFARLIDLGADLAENPVLVLGSSKQRQAINGVTREDAARTLIHGLHSMTSLAEARGVCIVVEPLAPHLCNVINTLSEAMSLVQAINSPSVQTMFDSHNTAAESMSVDALLKRYFIAIKHVHLNEMDGRRPGVADFPFGLAIGTLKDLGYKGWLSVEVFDFRPDGETVARLASQYLHNL